MKVVISGAVVCVLLILGFVAPQSRAKVKPPVFSSKDTLYSSDLKVPDQKLIRELNNLKNNLSSFECLVNDVKNIKVIAIDTVSIKTDSVNITVDSVKKKERWFRRAINKFTDK
jgi:hypothetical protein